MAVSLYSQPFLFRELQTELVQLECSDIDGIEIPSEEELEQELEIIRRLVVENRKDASSQFTLKLKVAKLRISVFMRQESKVFFESLGDVPVEELNQEQLIVRAMLIEFQMGKLDVESIPVLEKKINTVTAFRKIRKVLAKGKRSLKGLQELEDQFKKNGTMAVEKIDEILKKQFEHENVAETPEDADAFQLPTDKDLAREVEYLKEMQEENRTDPAFQRAVRVKLAKIEIYKAFFKKADELQLRDRLDELTVEKFLQDAQKLTDLLTDFQNGNADVESIPVLQDKINELVALLEISEVVAKLKTDLKEIEEQEEQCVKEGTMVWDTSEHSAEASALP